MRASGRIATVACRVAVLCLVSLVAATTARGAGRKIDVGGFKLKIYCSGKGEPVVVLDAGAGDSHEVWRNVQPRVARFTRVCSYDRAGLGKSDPGPLPRTSGTMVEELHTLLQQASVEDRLVLVGHSLGGMNARLFARRYPDRVSALVLVEATHPDYPARAAEHLSREEAIKQYTSFALGGTAARSEYESMRISAAEVRAAGAMPAVPTVVITAGRPESSAELRELWLELQREMASAPSVLRHVVAETSDHGVQLEEPRLVVDMIRQVVDRLRAEVPAKPEERPGGSTQ